VQRHEWLKVAGRAAGALLCLTASCIPAGAARRTLSAGDGTVIIVWDQKGRIAPGHSTASWSITYSVTDASGTHLGVVPPTGDAARDSSPFLALDATGAPVLVWSRFDGVYNKIAYARYAGGAWTNFHYLTFGSGDDDLPLVASGTLGSYLFYVAQPDRYLYVPLDLTDGRLFAAPRVLDLGILHRPTPWVNAPGPSGLHGGLDVPVNNRGCKEPRTCGRKTPGLVTPSGTPTILGGIDAPIVNGRGAIWAAGSGGACSHMVLVVPTADLKWALVVDFYNGLARVLLRLALSAKVPDGFGDDLAASYLPALCN